jgi:hypothetical protein
MAKVSRTPAPSEPGVSSVPSEKSGTATALASDLPVRAKSESDGPKPTPARDRNAEEIARPPATRMDIDDLLAYWKSIPEKQRRSRVMGYLYRLQPILRRADGEHSIEKYSEPIESKEKLLSQWGAGEYRLDLTDNGRTKGFLTRARWEFRESYHEHPPVLNVDELDLNHKDNRSYIEWLRAKGFLGGAVQQNAGNDVATQTLASIAKEGFKAAIDAKTQQPITDPASGAFKVMSEGYTQSLNLIKDQLKPISLKEQIELVKELVPKSDGDSSLVAVLIKQNGDLMMKLLERKESDPFGWVKSAAALIPVLQPILGPFFSRAFRQTAAKDEWWHMLEPAVPQLAGALNNLASGFSAGRRAPMMQGGFPPPGAGMPPPGFPPGPGAPPPGFPPPGVPGRGPGLEGIPGQQPQMQEQQQPQFAGGEMEQRLMGLLAQVWPFLVNMLNQGTDGREFADWLAAAGGLDLGSHGLIKMYGRDRLVGLVRQTPLYQQVQPIEAQFVVFIDQFLTWAPGWDDGEEEEQQQPAAGMPVAGPVDFRGGQS